jgi:ABC-type multidrug transport system fused ATPase/permease subunit
VREARLALSGLASSQWNKVKRLISTAEAGTVTYIVLKAALGAASNSLDVLNMTFLSGAFDSVQAVDPGLGLDPMPQGALKHNLSMFLLTKLCSSAAHLLQSVCHVRGSMQFVLTLRKRLYTRLLEQDVAFFDSAMRPHQADLLLREAGEIDVKLLDLPGELLQTLARVVTSYAVIYQQAGLPLLATLAFAPPLSSWFGSTVELWIEGTQRKVKLRHSERSGTVFR